jgi:hypothetical protein
MNKKIYLLLCVLLAWSFNLKAQTAQIESKTAIPGASVSFKIDVTGFPSNVGAISLFIGYDPGVLTYSSTTPGTLLAADYVTNNMLGTHQVGIQWTNPSGQAINGTLLTLNFTYSVLGGACDLTFNAGCEFADILLNSIVVAYTNGHIGPVAGIATLTIPDTLAISGPLSLPIKAAGFPTNVGAITLFIQYNSVALTYINSTPGTLTGYFASASNGVIGITWTSMTGAPINGTMLTLNFNYNGGSSQLPFINGCEIVKANFDPIIVSYNAGSVGPLATSRTMTLSDEIAVPGNPVSFDITAAGYPGNVGAITLYIGYDPGCLTFVNITGGTISGASAAVVTPGILGITWTNPSGQGINGLLLSLNFQYIIGECAMTFEPNCEIADKNLVIIPSTFYDGSLSQGSTTATATIPTMTGVVGQPISFPILVSGFPNNVGAISLFISFNSSVLQYTGTTAGTLTGYFANYMPIAQRVGIQWSDYSGLDISPVNGSTLLSLNFIYLGGSCELKFSAGCEFTDNALNPIPVSYFNGAIIVGIKLDVTALLEGPFNGTDMNTGINSILPLNQPYSGLPWNYGGTETVGSIPNTDIVDWVLVELRETAGGASAATSGTMVAQSACFILKDGKLVGLDGTNKAIFSLIVSDSLYVVIYHRNHLGVMSANALTHSYTGGFNVYSYNFTDGQSKAYNNGQKALTGGKFGLYAGDYDGNGDINLSDVLDIWVPEFGAPFGYNAADANLDGQVDLSDLLDFWVNNFGTITQIP